MDKVLILGAGGHAQVIADILLRCHDIGQAYVPIGYLDDNTALNEKTILGLSVLGVISDLAATEHDFLLLGIGDNMIRRILYERLCLLGEQFLSISHPTVTVGCDVLIEHGAVLCAGTIVNPATYVGADAILNTGCTVDHHNWIGPHAHIAPGVHLGGGVRIGAGRLDWYRRYSDAATANWEMGGSWGWSRRH